MTRNKDFRCTICGRFIGYSEIEKNEVVLDFTPDTERTIEKHEFTHKKCQSKNG